MAVFVNPTAISRLLGCGRQTARDRLLAGDFGPVLRHGRGVYVALAAVERFAGIPFSEGQVTRAAAGWPERVVTLSEMQEVA